MKERPILFSAPMVRAILAGSKTQTRRVVNFAAVTMDRFNHNPTQGIAHCLRESHMSDVLKLCPYGVPGDRLWCREAWRTHSTKHDRIAPRDLSPHGDVMIHYDASLQFVAPFLGRGRPSIHMPRWASRITLEITGVRVERLQDISKADAIAEGLEWRDECWATYDADGRMVCGGSPDPREAYRCLWININGPGSWDLNPWVWALTFRRLP